MSSPQTATVRSILVVDDDVELLRFLRETLTALAHCSVDSTPSPEYAFELALRKPYDLFVFDFQMPRLDGAVLYSFIRKVHDLGLVAPARPAPPLLLLSGHGEQRGVRQMLGEPGVRGLLAKPFPIQRLLSRCRNACRHDFPSRRFLSAHPGQDLRLDPPGRRRAGRGTGR